MRTFGLTFGAVMAAAIVCGLWGAAGVSERVLAQTTSCGGLNQECCSSSESDARARCPGGLYLTCEPTGRGGMCVPCGRYGQRCCEPLQEFGGKSYCPFAGGAFCASSGKTPDHGTCLACGMPGQVSCSFDEDRRLYDSGEEANETQRYCWDGRSPSKETFKCPEGASDPVVVESFWSSAKPCTYYDWSKDQLLEGTNTAGCQAKVAATSCESTQLYKLGGEDVVPDQCLGKKGKGYIAQFTPPCATSEQNASSNVNVECTYSSRKAYCGTDGPFCEHGDWICSGETMPEEDWSGSVQLKAGTAEYWFGQSSAANALTAVTCDGRVLLLVRPGLGAQRTSVFDNGRLMSVYTEFGPVPFENIDRTGTTIAWVVVPSQPVAGKPKTVRASADVYVFDDGIMCLGSVGTNPGISYGLNRTIESITCEATQLEDVATASEVAPEASLPATTPAVPNFASDEVNVATAPAAAPAQVAFALPVRSVSAVAVACAAMLIAAVGDWC